MDIKTDFKLRQLKLIHYHLNTGDMAAGDPLVTCIELKNNYKNDKLIWTKMVSHTYRDFNNWDKKITDTYTEELELGEELISEIEKNDLRELKNNYFTEEEIESYCRWELNYNYYFKIVGTYDQEIQTIRQISNLLDFRKIIKEETKKIANKIKENNE